MDTQRGKIIQQFSDSKENKTVAMLAALWVCTSDEKVILYVESQQSSELNANASMLTCSKWQKLLSFTRVTFVLLD